jgi:cellulose synthase/poly-beta-1,6-N-acetylglucosamine synthase-like glycosyltransferase
MGHSMLVKSLFWLSVCLVAYEYAGHPALLFLLARMRPRKWLQDDVKLSVAVFISAYNEEKGLGAKIRNVLDQDYQGPYTIIVSSDGSIDRTAEIARSFNDPRIILHDFKANRGKAAMQNEIIPALPNDVVIFSDATSVWPKDAVRNIVRNFADSDVGCVAVDLCFVSENNGVVEKGQGAYWKYERFLRRYGALVRTNIVASGTTYAIRKSLFRPIRSDIGEDLSNPLQIAMTGRRVIFDPEIVVEEKSSSTHASEIRMRKRIAVRNVTGLASYVKFLNPRYGFAAYQLFVHKYLRVFCWAPMLIALFTNYLLRDAVPYSYLFIMQAAVYLLALIGYMSVRMGTRVSRFTYLPYYFALLNFACMMGVIQYVRGVRRPTWTPDR